MHHIVVLSAAGTTKWWMEWQARKGYAHTHTLCPPFSHPQSIHTWSACAHQARRLWRSCGRRNVWAVLFCRAVAIKQKHLQHERIPAIYKRKWKIRQTMSEFCSAGWSVKPSGGCCCCCGGRLFLSSTAHSPSSQPSVPSPSCPSVSPHKLYFLAPIRRRISVTSQKTMSTHPDCRLPLCNSEGPSRASLWTWQLQGTFQLWKVYLDISANVLKWNILLSKLSWYKPVVGRQ